MKGVPVSASVQMMSRRGGVCTRFQCHVAGRRGIADGHINSKVLLLHMPRRDLRRSSTQGWQGSEACAVRRNIHPGSRRQGNP